MIATLTHVALQSADPRRFASVLDPEMEAEFQAWIRDGPERFRGRVIWNVNSTAHGGGVAEMLWSLLGYLRGLGIDARWVVIQGSPAFFVLTKRLHNLLHGALQDRSAITEAQRATYEETLSANADELVPLIRPADIVILHDPQTVGLVPRVVRTGAAVVWRSHVGVDRPNDAVKAAWSFLTPYLAEAHAYVFSRRAYLWEGLDTEKVEIIAPSIDAFSVKNQDLDDGAVKTILRAAALLPNGIPVPVEFARSDGGPLQVHRATQMFQDSMPPAGARLVVQVSRWDRLKDAAGVMDAFATFIAPHTDAHLVLAGPAPGTVADDPEEVDVLDQLQESWLRLPAGLQSRVHLARLPMDDADENAAIVNALQRRAAVVIQKSIAEGFGLTVAEAMWKARPVVATRVGGIQDQIEHGISGVLIDDPRDLEAVGQAVVDLLTETDKAARMGVAARRRVQQQFLAPRQLIQWARLFSRLRS